MSDNNPAIKLSDRIKKIKNGLKLHTYQELGEEKGKMPETKAAEKDGKVVASFDKKEDESIGSSATSDAQLNGAYEDSAKAAGYKKEDLVYTVPTLRAAQAALAEDKDSKDSDNVESAKLAKADSEGPKEPPTLDYSKMKAPDYKPWHWKEKLAVTARSKPKVEGVPPPPPTTKATPPPPDRPATPATPPKSPTQVTAPKPKYELGQKLKKAEDSSQDTLAKAEEKKPAYGTDPVTASEINKRFSAAHAKMSANIANHPDMKNSEKKKRMADLDRKKKYFDEGEALSQRVQNIKNMPGDHPDTPKPYLSNGNTKLAKDGIWSWNLPAGHTCPGKGDCFGFCYAMTGHQAMGRAKEIRQDNFGTAERDDFVPKMNEALKSVGDRIRVHDSGDFYSQDYVNKWADIAKANPHKNFYAYTKALHLNLDPLHSQPNFKVIQSVGGNQDHKIDTSKPHAFIFPSHEALAAAGYANASDSDLAAMDKNNTKIGLVIHGGRAKQFDPKDYGNSLNSDKAKNPLAKSSGRYHLVGGEIPDVHKFDQIDMPSQLEQSPNPGDQMKAMRLKTNEGSYSSAMDQKIKEIKAIHRGVTEPTLAQKIEAIKAKHRTPETPTLAQQIEKMKTKYKSSLIKNEDESSSDPLKKGRMIRGSIDDAFPKTYEALVMDGDGDDHEVMKHHMKLHQNAANTATTPAAVRHHYDNINKIHNHLASLNKSQDIGMLGSNAQVSRPSADTAPKGGVPSQSTSALPPKTAPIGGVIK